MDFDAVLDPGHNPLKVVQPLSPVQQQQDPYFVDTVRHWDLNSALQDGGGDGTVPVSSGRFPLRSAGDCIQQQFGVSGITHEGAFKEKQCRIVTLYALQKIAAKAKARACE